MGLYFNMKALNLYPMARILLPFMAGILLAPVFNFNWTICVLIPLVLLLFMIFWLFALKRFRNYKRRWVSGFIITVLFFNLGMIGDWAHIPVNSKNHYSKISDGTAYLIEINSSFSETPKTYKSTGRIEAVFDSKDSIWKPTKGNLLLYFQKQEGFSLNYGNKIISTSKLIPIQAPQNPYAFDYSNYMSLKGIYDQSFIKEHEWLPIESEHAFDLQSVAINLRIKLLSILNNLQYDTQSTALAAALLIGYDEYLDDDLRARFAGSGAMHILCVSGLHVGIIFMLCNFLFGFLNKFKLGNIAKTIIILITIWFYALITGLSPSVMRASTMFTFILIGKSFNRKSNTYNSLAASAFLLLLLNPNLIYNIGFQLSYGAVLAILYIQPKLFGLIYFNNSILRNAWALICVSIAAQLGTFPLAVYYFHQFPNYFILTNLWVIPLSFILVSVGIFVLALALLGFTSTYLGILATTLLKYCLIGLNNGVEIINRLPFAISENLALNKFQVLIIYIFLLMLSTLVLYQKRSLVVPMLSSLLLLILSSVYQNTTRLNTNTWIVYKADSYTAMDFISQQKSYLLGDSAFISDPQKQKFILAENHIKNGVKQSILLPDFSSEASDYGNLRLDKDLILFHSLRILYLDQTEKNQAVENPLPIDFLVISKNADINLTRVLSQYRFSTIIFDSSNSWWRIKQIKDEADRLNIPYWDVNEKGAFVLTYKKPPERIQRV